MVPRPACEPTTGPMSPTTISPSTCGRSIADELVDVATVGVQHEEAVEPVDGGDLVDEERERLAAGALLAALLDLAVAHLDDRLDRQRRRQQRLGAADATALLQVVERVERAPHVCAAGEVVSVGDDLVVRRAVGREPGTRGDDRAEARA